VPFVRQLHGFDSEPRSENPVLGRRRAAALEMTEHAATRFFSSLSCDFARDNFANSTQPKLARFDIAFHLLPMFRSGALVHATTSLKGLKFKGVSLGQPFAR
jgi:hypothetical protein